MPAIAAKTTFSDTTPASRGAAVDDPLQDDLKDDLAIQDLMSGAALGGASDDAKGDDDAIEAELARLEAEFAVAGDAEVDADAKEVGGLSGDEAADSDQSDDQADLSDDDDAKVGSELEPGDPQSAGPAPDGPAPLPPSSAGAAPSGPAPAPPGMAESDPEAFDYRLRSPDTRAGFDEASTGFGTEITPSKTKKASGLTGFVYTTMRRGKTFSDDKKALTTTRKLSPKKRAAKFRRAGFRLAANMEKRREVIHARARTLSGLATKSIGTQHEGDLTRLFEDVAFNTGVADYWADHGYALSQKLVENDDSVQRGGPELMHVDKAEDQLRAMYTRRQQMQAWATEHQEAITKAQGMLGLDASTGIKRMAADKAKKAKSTAKDNALKLMTFGVMGHDTGDDGTGDEHTYKFAPFIDDFKRINAESQLVVDSGAMGDSEAAKQVYAFLRTLTEWFLPMLRSLCYSVVLWGTVLAPFTGGATLGVAAGASTLAMAITALKLVLQLALLAWSSVAAIKSHGRDARKYRTGRAEAGRHGVAAVSDAAQLAMMNSFSLDSGGDRVGLERTVETRAAHPVSAGGLTTNEFGIGTGSKLGDQAVASVVTPKAIGRYGGMGAATAVKHMGAGDPHADEADRLDSKARRIASGKEDALEARIGAHRTGPVGSGPLSRGAPLAAASGGRRDFEAPAVALDISESDSYSDSDSVGSRAEAHMEPEAGGGTPLMSDAELDAAMADVTDPAATEAEAATQIKAVDDRGSGVSTKISKVSAKMTKAAGKVSAAKKASLDSDPAADASAVEKMASDLASTKGFGKKLG